MTLQPFSQNTTVRFAKLATSGLLMIQATVATTAISAFVAIQPGLTDRAVAQERPAPQSTSAGSLGKPLQTNCQPTRFDEEKPSFCGGAGYGPDVPDDKTKTPTPTTESPVNSIQITLPPNCTHPSGQPAMICLWF